ncbi:hypothetical protein D9757_010608 [Collybiopsis confluens]|uniref:C2H2-type domain-containing protein n=1 Tax=Collybiopsis confluens TaxID=2823264 RepID=A0A8H5LW99_9AGAR|nr:hypothetical protein D9757_010608 [Collybiopsis confluens]
MYKKPCTQRHYASEQYLLPADEVETNRLDYQHLFTFKTFENRLSIAPIDLKSGDRVLESAAGTGIWAIDFFEENRKNDVLLDIECIDICDKQFRKNRPFGVHFSIHSVTDLPAEWSSTFSYVYQRLITYALNESLWRKSLSELFRVLLPGGWVELMEVESQTYHIHVGPCSTKLQSLIFETLARKGVIMNLAQHLSAVLKTIGFVDIQCEARQVRIGRSGEKVYRSSDFANFVRGLKRDVVKNGMNGTEEEYEDLVRGAEREWDNSDANKASFTIFTILARKP